MSWNQSRTARRKQQRQSKGASKGDDNDHRMKKMRGDVDRVGKNAGRTGLRNRGRTCFVNAALQALAATKVPLSVLSDITLPKMKLAMENKEAECTKEKQVAKQAAQEQHGAGADGKRLKTGREEQLRNELKELTLRHTRATLVRDLLVEM